MSILWNIAKCKTEKKVNKIARLKVRIMKISINRTIDYQNID